MNWTSSAKMPEHPAGYYSAAVQAIAVQAIAMQAAIVQVAAEQAAVWAAAHCFAVAAQVAADSAALVYCLQNHPHLL